MNVGVISQEILKPSLPTPDHLRYLQVSLLDQLNSPFFVPAIYFFPCPNNITHHQTNTFLQKIKTSLSTTLSIYYPLAGRLHNANYVACNDEGVPYLHAEVRLTNMADVVRKLQISDLDNLLPPSSLLEQQHNKGFPRLLLAVQVNSFSCGGVAIGMKTNHRIADAFGILMFVNAWAHITRGKHPDLLPRPYFDTYKLFPPPQQRHNPIVDDVLEDPNPNILFEKPVTKWFKFTRETIEALRSRLCCSSKNNLKSISLPSVSTVLSAFIWSRIIIACKSSSSSATANQIIPYEVFVPVNIRAKVSTPDDNSFYFGNFFVNAVAKPSCVSLADAHGDDADLLCCDFMEKVKESVDKLQNDEELGMKIKRGVQDLRSVTDQFERVKRGEIRIFGFSNVTRLPVLKPDFGWGKLVWAVAGTMVDGVVLLTQDGPYSKDVIATINLIKEDMIKLEADQVFDSLVFKEPILATSKL